MHVTLDHVAATAANIKTFYFKPARRVRYTAGEFVEVYLPHDAADNRGQKRWFTLSSSPSEELLSITTKLTAKQGSSFKRALMALQPGDEVMLSDPMGDFILPKDPTIPLVFVGAGIGITPIRSITKWLADKQEQRDARLIYSVSSPGEVAFGNLFEQYYGQRFNLWNTQEAGRLTGATLAELGMLPAGALYYLSGPEAMARALARDLRETGADKRQIVTDYFPGYPV